MDDVKYVSMFGCDIYAGTLEDLIVKLMHDISKDTKNVVFAINPLKVMLADQDKKVKEILLNADILIPDGVGILYTAKKRKLIIRERITGIDLMNKMCKVASETGIPIFIYGASAENLKQAIKNLKRTFRGIKIAGYMNGYEKDNDYINRCINESGAEILFVACGSPLQEIYIDENRNLLPNIKFFLGVGGSVDVISGKVKRAPKWIIRLDMEWLYRIIFQPKRIVHIKEIIKFLLINRRAS